MLVAAPSKLAIRPLNLDEDYLLLMEWWRQRGLTELTKDIFPDLGAVVHNETRPVAMAFLYVHPGRLAMIEWASTNPSLDISGRQKLQGIKDLFEHLEMEARLMGCRCVLSMVVPRSSEDRLLSRSGWTGFGESDVPHVMFAKRLR